MFLNEEMGNERPALVYSDTLFLCDMAYMDQKKIQY